jgi:UDP-glucose 4-epimerase
MTRFLMTLDEAVELVIYAFLHATNGDIMVQKADASTIGDLAAAVKKAYDSPVSIRRIGIRHGEKMYETLLTNEECERATDLGNFYRVPADQRGLNYDQYYTEGSTDRNILREFNSNNTEQLTIDQIVAKLMTVPEFRQDWRNWQTRKDLR